MKNLFLIIFFVLLVSTAYSASMQAPSIGARATGMGGAFVAVADDPSAIYWNPAGLGMVEGTAFMNGTAFVYPHSYYEADGADKEKSITTTHMIPNLFFTHNFNDSFSMGLGYYTPFGLGQRWKDDASLKYNSTRSEINLSNIQGGLSYRLTDNLLIGAGLAEGFAKTNTKSFVLFPAVPPFVPNPVDGYMKLDGEGKAYSGNIGFLWEPSTKCKIGGVWRSQTKMKFKGNVDLKYPQEYEQPPIGLNRVEDDFSMDFTFPPSAALGIAYQPTERWLLSGQVDWTGWSTIDTLEVKTDTLGDLKFTRDWKDTYIFRVGAEYKVNPQLTLRGGYMWDPSPVPKETLDPMMFDVSSNRFFVGASFPVWKMNVDVAYSYSQGIKREAEDSENIPSTDGDYWGYSNVFELSTTYTF